MMPRGPYDRASKVDRPRLIAAFIENGDCMACAGSTTQHKTYISAQKMSSMFSEEKVVKKSYLVVKVETKLMSKWRRFWNRKFKKKQQLHRKNSMSELPQKPVISIQTIKAEFWMKRSYQFAITAEKWSDQFRLLLKTTPSNFKESTITISGKNKRKSRGCEKRFVKCKIRVLVVLRVSSKVVDQFLTFSISLLTLLIEKSILFFWIGHNKI